MGQLQDAAGSSPLARGLRSSGPGHVQLSGIIPARAGFTTPSPPASFWTGGSSPLARGLPRCQGSAAAGGRIIPARAGFTGRRPGRGRSVPDHPRSRGVYWCGRLPVGRRRGSSPLARGLPRRRRADSACSGIIPARAGFTVTITSYAGVAADHPRSRGVYGIRRWTARISWGSSPLARGLLVRSGLVVHMVGIIPARAGFTDQCARPCWRPPDHPRSRGVYGDLDRLFHDNWGSSPLARGLRTFAIPASCAGRIIPARAGFTVRRSRG